MDLVTVSQVLGNFGEFIGAIAVVATLFYLALQVREGKKATDANTYSLEQNRKVAMAQVVQNRVRTNVEVSKWLVESDFLLRINNEIEKSVAETGLVEALERLDPEDRRRYVLYARTTQWVMDALFQLHESGLLDDETYGASFTGIEGVMGGWIALDEAGMAQPLRPSFRREVEKKLAETDTSASITAVMGLNMDESTN